MLRNAIRSCVRLFALVGILALVPMSGLSAQVNCSSNITITGQPRIGTTIQFQVTGTVGCHSCVWISKNPGPVQIGPVTIPIGLPLLNVVDFGTLPPSGSYTVPLQVPADPNTIGLQLFFTDVSFPSAVGPTIQNVRFSPAAVITIVP